MPVNALHVLGIRGPEQARAASAVTMSAVTMTERPAGVDRRRPSRARLEEGQPDSPTLGDPAAARRGAPPSSSAPSHASARPCPSARGLLRAALCALMLMTLMCGLAAPAAAQQLAPTGVTLTPGDGQLTVAWTMPAGADGTTDATTLTHFSIDYNAGSSVDLLAAQSVNVIPTSPTQRELCRFSLFSTTQVIELLNLCTPNSPQYGL